MTVNKIYLHREDLNAIAEFLDAFGNASVVEVISDTSSGIGAIITARITGQEVNGMTVNVERVIADEGTW